MRVLFPVLLLSILLPRAYALTGIVSDENGLPIKDAIVQIPIYPDLVLRDTTEADGSYLFTYQFAAGSIRSEAQKQSAFLNHGILNIPLSKTSSILLEIFKTDGSLIRRQHFPNTPAGNHQFPVPELSSHSKIAILKVTIDNRVSLFQSLQAEHGQPRFNPTASNRNLGKRELQTAVAVLYEITVSALGYKTLNSTFLGGTNTLNFKLQPEAPQVGSSGCGKAPTLKNGTINIQSGGTSRSYIIDIPTDYDKSHPYRLVLGYHWLGSNMTDVATGQTVAKDLWAFYGLKQISNNSTIFIAPNGIGGGWDNPNGRDLIFTDDILKQVKSDLCIDTTRIFANGFSFGGGMSYALACDRANVFRAVAVQSGATLSGCTDGTKPVPYFGASSLTETKGRALGEKMAALNGCTTQVLPLPAEGSNTHICVHYQGCKEGYPVEWCTHTSGHTAAPYDGGPGDSGTKTWVPAEIWKFFTQF